MRDAAQKRNGPAPFAAAITTGEHPEVHIEFDAVGNTDTGSIDLGSGVTLRYAQGTMRLVVPPLPQTLIAALPGRHVSVVVSHPWLGDPRLIISRVDDEDERLSIIIDAAPTEILPE